MSDGLFGLERDVVLHTLMQDKSPIVVSPVVKPGVSVERMTLQSTEYRIYPQGILFFKKFLTQWNAINELLSSSNKINVRMNISFYHRGRGLYFISPLNRVQNGYALMIPSSMQKMPEESYSNSTEISAKIFHEEFSGILARCECSKEFPLFEKKHWLNFSKKDFMAGKELLHKLGNLEEVRLGDVCTNLLVKHSLLLYVPEKKIPQWNFFPYPVTLTENHVDFGVKKSLEAEVVQCKHPLYIPLCEREGESMHTLLGLHAKMLLLTPSDVFDALSMLPICKYLSQKNNAKLASKESTTLTILGISDSSIILGCSFLRKHILSLKNNDTATFPLLEGEEYSLQISIPEGYIQRTIVVKISVSQIYTNDKNYMCGICRFLNLQEEDRRFLYEKYYGSKLR